MNTSAILESKLDSLFQAGMYEQRIPGAAIIIVKDGKTLFKKGYGFTELGEDMEYVDPDSTIFRIGSISKTFTTLALLQQLNRNGIDLYDNIDPFLTSLGVESNYEEPITYFNLLTHSAGFDELDGRRVFNESEQIPLAEFLKTNLRQIRPPGEVTAYSTYGIALAGLLVEELSSQPLEHYFKRNIWEPLGMHLTSIELPENHSEITSLGYEIYNNINIPQPWEWYHTFPASSINSTVTDMGFFMQMLLNNGVYQNQVILKSDLAAKMLEPQFSIHSEVDGFTLGLYQRSWNGVPSINHGGDMLGFSSHMTLLPDENIGIFVVHHHEGGSLRHRAIELILELLVGTSIIERDNVALQEDLSSFAGKYVWLSNCQSCEDSQNQQIWTLEVNEEEYTLSGFNRNFYQIKPLLFKSKDGQRTMGFKKDENGNVRFMTLGNINVFEKIE